MERYIDAEKISSHIRENFSIDKTKNADICFAFIDFMNWLDEQPIAGVAEVRRGKWIGFDNEKVPIINGCPTCSCLCSLCGDWLSVSDEYFVKGNYCPNCGAKMNLE